MSVTDSDAITTDHSARLRIRVLGHFEVDYDGRLAEISGAARSVLALLARTPGRVVSVASLTAGLWGPRPPAHPENALASYISRLRRALSRVPDLVDPAAIVVTRAPGYVLAVAPFCVDSFVFENTSTQGRRALAAGQPALAATRLRDALALWRGDAYAEFADHPFAQTEASRLDELRMSAMEARIDADLAVAAPDAPAALAAELEGHLASHPHRERLWAQLMTALFRVGRQADALDAYRRARTRLVEDLGVEPGAALRTTERAVLDGDPVLTGVPIRPTAVPDPLTDVSPFCVGRDDELAWLTEALDQAACEAGQARLVIGPTGLGKTQLAAELARRAAARGAVCRYGRGPSALDALRSDPTRLSLVLVDDVDELSTLESARVAAWVRASADHPVLTVVTAQAVLEGFAHLPSLVLAPLSPPSVAELVRLYAPATEADALAAVAGAGGVPADVHAAVAQWATDQAGRRVDRAVALATEPRALLSDAHDEIVAGVLDLERVRARARSFRAFSREVVLCPYKGLARFEPIDADLFHGREQLVAELIAHLVEAPFLALVGASGSGKSSVVRAGLVPTLAAGALPGSARWRQIVLTPVSSELVADVDLAETPTLLVVDQFEEVFTGLEADRRGAFISSLVTAVNAARATVVLTLRSDFYGHCAEYPDLGQLVAANNVLVRPMSGDELRSAIQRPADLAGLAIEDGLTNLLVDDLRDAPGGLPLLSTALLSLWERRAGSTLTLAAYRESGGVAGAIQQLGEQAYARLSSADEREAARRILLRLADSGGERAVVRRKASRAEVDAVGGVSAQRVLDVMAERRLVTVSDDVVEVAHEALLTHWPRLRTWLVEDAVGRELRAHLSPAAAAWAASGNDDGELYRGARLAAAHDWAQQHPYELTSVEREFLSASQSAAVAEELRRVRTMRRLRQLLVAAGVALVLALVGGYAALTQQRRADAASVQADARRLGAQALVEQDLRRAMLLAVAATKLEVSWQTTGNLLATLNRTPSLLRTAGVGGGERLLGMAVSQDGATVAVSNNGRRIQIYEADTFKLKATVHLQGIERVRWLSFTPDGRHLLGFGVSDSIDKPALQLWDVETWQRVGAPFGPSSHARAVNSGGGILGDGDSVVTVDDDNSVAVWSLGSHRRVRTLLAPGEYRSVDVPAGGRTIVVHAGDGDLLVDGYSGEVRRRLPAATGSLISPDGRTLLAGSVTGDIAVWDITTGTRRGVAHRHTSAVADIAWSPDGRTFASTSEDLLTVVWDAASLQPSAEFSGPAGRQLNVRYSPDGRTLYTAGQDGGLYAWDLTRQRGLERELDPPGFYSGAVETDNPGPVVFDFPRERAIVLDSDAAYIVDLRTGKPTGPPLRLGADRYEWPALSADGRRLAVGFNDGHGGVWDLEKRRLLLDTGPISVPESNVDAALSPDGRLVAFAGYRVDEVGSDGLPTKFATVVWIYDVDSGTKIGDPWIIDDLEHERLAISRDGRYVAISLDGAGIHIWDLANGRVAAVVPEAAGTLGVRFSPDGQYLAAGGFDGRPSLWRVGTWQRLWKADTGHNGQGLLVSFSPDGRILSSSGTDSKIFLYDVSNGALVGRPLGPDSGTFLYAEFRPDRDEIVGYFNNGALHRWDLDVGSWVRRACEIAGRDMTVEEWRRVLPDRPYQHVCPG